MSALDRDRTLLAIVAAILNAGDGIEAALIARDVNDEAQVWTAPAADGATPRLTIPEIVSLAFSIVEAVDGELELRRLQYGRDSD